METGMENLLTDPKVMQFLREIEGQRVEILKAFIAKYGYEPENVIQILFEKPPSDEFPHGAMCYYIRKMTDEEREMKINWEKGNES